MASSKGSDSTKSSRYNLPQGKVLSALDDEVDWTMVAIEMRAFLMRFEGYEKALFESQLVDLNARAEQKKRLSKTTKCCEHLIGVREMGDELLLEFETT